MTKFKEMILGIDGYESLPEQVSFVKDGINIASVVNMGYGKYKIFYTDID